MVFLSMSSHVSAFKVVVFAKWLWILNWSKWIVVDIPARTLLTVLLFIDYSSRCKLKFYIITHTKEKPSMTNGCFLQNWYRQGNESQKS